MGSIRPPEGWGRPSPRPPGGWDTLPLQVQKPQAGQNTEQSVQYAYLTERPLHRYLQCKICDQGALASKKTFRMSAPVVAIGFILLVPSVLGMIFSALVFFGALAASGTGGVAASVHARNEAISEMRNNDVPEPIIAAVIANPNLDAVTLMDQVSMAQLSWIEDAQAKLRARVPTGVAFGIFGLFASGTAILFGISCFVGGLLGWLPVMRKRVLQCALCRAVVNAS